jgi:O-antigen biosynthesis protein
VDKCRGELIVLLNNDTIVTRNWVNQMQALINSSPAMGLVGPMSNYAAPPQLVETVTYRSGPRKSPRATTEPTGPRPLADMNVVQAFADEFRETHKGKWQNVDRLGGFCLMLRREVYKRLTQQGDFDKHTDLGLFDTDILSIKAKQYGYNLAVCLDLFVHHFGTRTFAHGSPEGNVAAAHV